MCDLNANTESREQPNLLTQQLQSHSVIHDLEREGKSTCGVYEYFLISYFASGDHLDCIGLMQTAL